MNTGHYRTERMAERAPAVLHPIIAQALLAHVPASLVGYTPDSDAAAKLRAHLELLNLRRLGASSVVDFCQRKLDSALAALSELDREIEQAEIALEEVTP